MSKSKIEWCNETWNPAVGCSPISPGCQHCWAAAQAYRFGPPAFPAGLTKMGPEGPVWNGSVVLFPDRLNNPLSWKRKRRAFVCSTSDLFHPSVPYEYIGKVFDVMDKVDGHDFIVLTKRSSRMREWFRTFRSDRPSGKNVVLSVTVENQDFVSRVDDLLDTPGYTKMVSVEPFVGPLDLSNHLGRGISWVIVGAESGSRGRPMEDDWVRKIRDDCQASGTAFFYKQAIKDRTKISFPVLDGQQYMELPDGISDLNQTPAQSSLF